MAKKIFQSPKGTKDVLPGEQDYWARIEEVIRRLMKLYGYERLDLPVFEETALFQRGVGEGTDIVEKEMYTFSDKGHTLLTLRPEFTAGVMRSYIQHGMSSMPTPVKVWSMGPVFRYERPQAGRYRQHTQFNVEALGEKDPALDFEIMSIAWQLYEELGFRHLSFQINSIGCSQCRPQYLKELVRYYKNHQNGVCEDCQRRLDKNPLRVLDCKKESCQPLIEKAPAIIDSLCSECTDHFQTLRGYLNQLKRPYQLDHRLVRGLDYYTKTVFEVWAEGIGAQNAVCGGGRYDGLAEILGGTPTPGVGFASGLERLVLILQNQEVSVSDVVKPQVYFVVLNQHVKSKVIEILTNLRREGIETVMGFGNRSLKAQMREANRREVQFTAIIGEEEIQKGIVQVKNMKESSQISMPIDQLTNYFKKNRIKEINVKKNK